MELLEKFEDHEFAPSFVARGSCPELGLRIYVHKADLRHAYSDDPQNAVDHVQEMYDHWNEFRDVSHEYGIAFARGFGVKRIVNFYLYSGVDVGSNPSKWRDANPKESHIMLLREGKVRDPESYEDNQIILGAEGFYRRTTPHLDFFMSQPPILGDVGLRVIR